ncbi:MAG TPA: class I SAM-dependent methyltransferase [Candidatus Baltobacteraceae bacterium]|nr:class I SAM-dependent methyltransferase [Candidatus Baltobacteraceae bacterium]
MQTSNIKSAFLDAILNGRPNTETAWLEYFERFHADFPTANDLFTLLTTLDRQTSYGLLASAAAKAGGDAILEIACGDGNLIDDLLAACAPSARVCATDICGTEIAIAQRRFEGEPRISFAGADARALPYGDESFDLVLSHQFFNFMPDLGPVLREAARVLKPSGTLLFAVNRGWKADRNSNWVRLYIAARDALRERYPQYYEHAIVEDPRIYSADGITEILMQSALFDMRTLSIESATPRALMAPDRIAAIYNRMYVFGSVSEKADILDAVLRRAVGLSQDGEVEIEIPFRIVAIKRPRRHPNLRIVK